MKLKKVTFITMIILAPILLIHSLNAQITQTGTLDGIVVNPEGQGIPGVQVTISSTAMLLPSMNKVTNENGFFRFPGLPPGMYQVVFELEGLNTLVQKNIIVNVAKTTTLNVNLEMTTLKETITVVGKTPTVDRERTTIVSNFSTDFIQSIPTTRNLGDYFNLAPGVTGDTTHGASVRDNTYNIDGVNTTDPVIGTQAGQVSMDIVDELSIQTGGHSAEFGGVRGAVVNVVTKSGGNRFSGSAKLFFRNDSLQSENTEGTIFEGQKGGFDYEYEPAVTLGGLIVKNKIWFFGSFNSRRSDEYILGYPWDKQPENTPYDRFRLMAYGKLTFQLSKNSKLTLSHNFSDYRRHHRDASVTRNEDSTWNQTTPVHVSNAHMTHFWNSNFYSNFKVAYLYYGLNLMAKNDLPRIWDSGYQRRYQSYGIDDIYTRTRFQFMTDSTWFVDDFMGRHEIKLGFEFEYSGDIRDRKQNRDPETGIGPFIYYWEGEPWYVINHQDFVRKDRKLVFGGFFQDSWNLSDRLSINFGLRFDHQEGIIPKQGADREIVEYRGVVYDPRVLKLFKPVIWNNIGPRIGIVYDLTGDGKTVAKFSFGRYYSANIMQYFITVNPNAHLYWRQRLDENEQPYGDIYSVGGQAQKTMDPDIKCPHIDELSIGIEREIVKDVRLSARYIRKWDRNIIEDVGTAELDLDALMRGDDIFSVWTNYKPVTALDPFNNEMVTFYDRIESVALKYYVTNPPGAKRDYDGVELILDKRFSNRWSFNTSYLYAKSRGMVNTNFDDTWTGESYFDNPNAHINVLGSLGLERRHQFKLNVMWEGPLGINLSCYYRYLAGRPYTRQIRSRDLGLDLSQGNITIYAEKRGSRTRPGLSILDIRAEKSFKLPGKWGRIAAFVDVFNAFNINTMTDVHTISSSSITVNDQKVEFGELTNIYDPRIIRLGVKYQF